ncbi:hypothetical protein [Bacillus subtilis]|uniref:hypothetical protein n=1 Tax=Bacillus subtilis TaxID=1423 RepID=UPI000849F57A|nr:hypothetical protein [Bacillus subtilis]ODV47896.1 hypothetical protein BCM26_05675 [Bacillus subtilis]OJH63494.1 hypothetical protein BOH71_09615 [Bacillus subtilis]
MSFILHVVLPAVIVMVIAVVIGYYYACLSPREKQKFWSNVLGALFCVLIIGILIIIWVWIN